jgi:hypothetical protein
MNQPHDAEVQFRTPALRKGGGRSHGVALALLALAVAALLGTGLLASGCGGGGSSPAAHAPGGDSTHGNPKGVEGGMTIDEVGVILERHRDALANIPGVIGTYIGAAHDSRLVIRVLLLNGMESSKGLIPGELEGVPVEVEMSDPIRPL